MLYSPLPGDHAKWVRLARSAATVSWELRSRAGTPAATASSHDARTGATSDWSLLITATVDNLFDAVYMDLLGYPALGRALSVGARMGF